MAFAPSKESPARFKDALGAFFSDTTTGLQFNGCLWPLSTLKEGFFFKLNITLSRIAGTW